MCSVVLTYQSNPLLLSRKDESGGFLCARWDASSIWQAEMHKDIRKWQSVL